MAIFPTSEAVLEAAPEAEAVVVLDIWVPPVSPEQTLGTVMEVCMMLPESRDDRSDGSLGVTTYDRRDRGGRSLGVVGTRAMGL